MAPLSTGVSKAAGGAAASPTPEPMERPEPHTLTATPAGIEIAYYVEPKRMYQVRRNIKGLETEWVEVPSVTTILGCLDKPALPWWGMGVGVGGVLELWEAGLVNRATDNKLAAQVDGLWVYATKDNLIDLLKAHRLTVNHVVAKAGDRGVSAHDAFEAWCATGAIPDENALVDNEPVYEAAERPYVEALRRFCEDIGDAWVTGGVEIAVGSVEHGYAGRYDARGHTTKPVRLVTQALTKDGKGPLKKGKKYVEVPAGKLLVDVKTSKGVYATHLLQLEGYEGAGIECGYEPTDARAVIHLTQFGEYEFKRARATYEDFLAVVRVYSALENTKSVL